MVDPVSFIADNVHKAVEKVKRKKACGSDSIFNEHMICGGSFLYGKLAQLYSDMYNYGYIPECLKRALL